MGTAPGHRPGGPRLFFYLVPKLTYFVFGQLSAVGFEEVVKYNNLETRDEKKCLGPGLCPVAVPINFAPSLIRPVFEPYLSFGELLIIL